MSSAAGSVSVSSFPQELREGLWHTTSPERFDRIRFTGAIVCNPDLPDQERWATARGPDFYPFVRTLGGVSLFDFAGFEPASYEKEYPCSSWRTFAPGRREWASAIWIEIDRAKVQLAFVSGKRVLELWKEREAYRHTVMPIIEAACIDAIPISAFVRVLRWSRDKCEFERLQC